jgi:DHA3 family tetracycline resistance protein-like MFS transporter
MLPQLVSRPQLQNGVILGTMGFMAALQFLGPSVAGLVVDAFDLASAFALEVALLLAGALVFSGLHTELAPATGRDVFGDLADGLRHVAHQPALRSLLLLALVPGVFFIGPFGVTIALVVPEVLGASDKWVGLLWGCFGAGVFSGSLLLTVRPLPRRGLSVCIANTVGGVILVLYGSSQSLPLSAAALFAWGIGAAVFINYVVTLLQEHTEPALMGRVMSMYSLVFFVSMPIGYAQSGLLTSLWDAPTTLVANGVAAAAIGALTLLFARSLRKLD